MTHITQMGIDLAKHIFQLHAVDVRGHIVLCRQVSRTRLRDVFAQLQPCLVGKEACGSAHYWVRELRTLGHNVRLIAPQFVAPIRRTKRMMATTPRRSVKPSVGPTCALSW
ncbi:MAG: transposase [Nitrospira sp.]|nr:transposase [Nitrospira sp.]